jgi:two-component system cell cycle sensor histidine kinase PleC
MQHKMFGELGHPRYDEYTTLIHDSGQLLLDLISDLLDMAKIEAGKLKLFFEQVDLESCIADCVRLVQGRALANNIEVKMVMETACLKVEADRRALKQVLLNLLSNAVKFTMNGGHVTATASVVGGRVTILVRDDGIGISKDDLPRLGRAFEQVVADPMLAKAGTGLGLALVNALVEQHNGTFRIESEEGIGTEVTIELPLRQPARAAA